MSTVNQPKLNTHLKALPVLLPDKKWLKCFVLFVLVAMVCQILYFESYTWLISTFSIINIPAQTAQPQHYQFIIDQYFATLSKQKYSEFNEQLTITGTDRDYLFEKFSHQFLNNTFEDSSMLMIGDSIPQCSFQFIITQLHNYDLYLSSNHSNQTQAFVKYLNAFNNRSSIPNNFNVNAFRNIYDERQKKRLVLRELRPAQNLNYRSNFDFDYKNLYLLHELLPNPQTLNKTSMDFSKINVIFHDFGGLHHLHLYPWRKYEEHTMENLINLESYFDEFIDVALDNKNIKCVIFRDVNPICSDQWVDDYAKAAKFYESMANVSEAVLLQNRSYEQFQQCLKEYLINPLELDKIYLNYSYNELAANHKPYILKGIDFCSERYTLTDYGSQTLNNRISTYVYNKQALIGRETLKLIYFNGYALFKNRCEFSQKTDGRHYHRLEAVHVNALLNIIKLFCE